MADTRHSKLFKPLPAYQLSIINELGIPKEHTTMEEILAREQIYVEKMIKAKMDVDIDEDEEDDEEEEETMTEFSHIKTFADFKQFVLSKQGAMPA